MAPTSYKSKSEESTANSGPNYKKFQCVQCHRSFVNRHALSGHYNAHRSFVDKVVLNEVEEILALRRRLYPDVTGVSLSGAIAKYRPCAPDRAKKVMKSAAAGVNQLIRPSANSALFVSGPGGAKLPEIHTRRGFLNVPIKVNEDDKLDLELKLGLPGME